jgi:hypothetical protein
VQAPSLLWVLRPVVPAPVWCILPASNAPVRTFLGVCFQCFSTLFI